MAPIAKKGPKGIASFMPLRECSMTAKPTPNAIDAGTASDEQFKAVMEERAGRPLDAYFQEWFAGG